MKKSNNKKSKNTKKGKARKNTSLEISRLKKNSFMAKILDIFTTNPLETFNYRQIASQLGIEDKASRDLVKNMLNDLKSVEAILEVSRGKFQLNPEVAEMNEPQGTILEGKIEIKSTGKGYVIVPGEDEDVFIASNNTGTAFNKDIVKVRLFPKRKDRKLEGKVIEVVKREKNQFVGVIQLSRKYAFVVIDGDCTPVDFFIPAEDTNNAKDGEKVVVELVEWPANSKNPIGKVVEVLGKPGDNNVEMMSILVNNAFPTHFPENVEREAQKIPTTIPAEEYKRRKDFRKITTFTIDPADAKDFDDAISIETLNGGIYEIGVHIADVSYYVKPGSIIDEEAFDRGTSVYLVDRTIPMLPETLSNNLCSLQPNVDKLCFSAVFQMDKNAKVHNAWFGRTIINSNRRMNYDEAQDIIEGKTKDDFSEILTILNGIAKKLRDNRFKKGAIDFGSEEVKFKLDEEGKPIEVYIKESKDSNHLIEEFMLLANRNVAEQITHFGKDKLTDSYKPFVYRVHDKPNEAKLQQFADFITKIGYKINLTNNKTISNSLNSLFKAISGKAEENMISAIAVRTMAKAVYSTTNIGHYGLAFDFYTHFTSPIRRYPDLMVHRLLSAYLSKETDTPSKSELEEKCVHCSEMEKRAADAERDSTKLKQMEYMVGYIGKVCSGVISGVSKWGLFVAVDICKGEGLVRLEEMKDDFYYLDEDNYQVLGFHHGKAYKLGDPVKVLVKKVDLQQKQMDLAFDE